MNKLLLLLWVLPLYAMDNDQPWQELRPRIQQGVEAKKLTKEKALACLLCTHTADGKKKGKLCTACTERVSRYNDLLQSYEKERFE